MAKSSTPLTITTSSLQRLIKDQASYEKELKQQEGRLEKLVLRSDSIQKASSGGVKERKGDEEEEDDDENLEFEIQQAV